MALNLFLCTDLHSTMIPNTKECLAISYRQYKSKFVKQKRKRWISDKKLTLIAEREKIKAKMLHSLTGFEICPSEAEEASSRGDVH
ncbi:hypothetical protein BpHYR1_029677 [Brachionus plicatilis]|uniref:Uncharacterized protein n=1 Tax=Brachionus plicatilis TaxID=10195 RepID=A0A3M7SD42_BRAPC|nr:hypothetical protein BpHYR1_029677 [Brachionus plicatilis]